MTDPDNIEELSENPLDSVFEGIRKLIRWTVISMLVISLIAITSLGLSTYVLYHRVQDNQEAIHRSEDTIVALCRQINRHNLDMQEFFLDLSVPLHELQFLESKECNVERLRQEYGVNK